MALALSLALLSPDGLDAQGTARWIELAPLTAIPTYDITARLLKDRVASIIGPVEPAQVDEPEALIQTLQSLDAGRTVFVLSSLEGLSRLPETGWRELARRGIEPVTPRMWGATFYVFASLDVEESSGPVKAMVRWAGAPTPELISRAKAGFSMAGFPSVDLSIMNRSDAMAQAFNQGTVSLVAILDEEPSAFLDGFVSRLVRPAQLWFGASVPGEVRRTDGLNAVTAAYDAQRFYVWPPNTVTLRATPPERVPAVIIPSTSGSRSAAFPLPVLLTNLGRTQANRGVPPTLRDLARVTTDTYVEALFEAEVSRCDERDAVTAQQFKTVLLNSLFNDRNNPFTVLALVGHLMFSRGEAPLPSDSYIRDYSSLGVLRRVLQHDHEFDVANVKQVLRWLQDTAKLKIESDRIAFARHAKESSYTQALDAIRDAAREPRPDVRRGALARARDQLVALAAAELPAACGQRRHARGMWRGFDFEPYFYLAVIDAMTRDPAGRK